MKMPLVNRPDLGLWAAADGAGGHEEGEAASGLIATALDSIRPAPLHFRGRRTPPPPLLPVSIGTGLFALTWCA
jgi:hypothetical protein